MPDRIFCAAPVQTCEEWEAGKQPYPLAPERGESFTQFLVRDPFGLRKAIVPVFWADAAGYVTGRGTAFAVDPWGTFITADHVVAEIRSAGRPTRDSTSGGWGFHFPPGEGFVVLLGIGLIFGTVRGPPQAMVRIVKTWTPAIQGDDPMATLQGRMDAKPLDLALLGLASRPEPDLIRNLPFRSKPKGPTPGDIVVAVGYPKIDTFRGGGQEATTRVEEGMFAAYGEVTSLHAEGRDRANPTPVFEVEAHWPSGMSGSPVFDLRGEVIGLVSRSLSPDGDQTHGRAWATWFEALPALPEWVPSLDTENPFSRRVLIAPR